MREKLIELLEGSLRYAGNVCGETGDCSKCQYDKYGANCGYAIRADYFIANGVTIAKWIPVTERLPSDNGKYLCHIFDSSLNNLQFIAMVYYDRGNFVTQSSCVTDCVTHWMPLPEPPKGE